MKTEVEKIKDAKFHCEEKINLAVKELIKQIGECYVDIENNSFNTPFGAGSANFKIKVKI